MIKLKVFLGVTILILLVLLLVGCGKPSTPKCLEDARDAVLSYLRDNVREDVPAAGVAWEMRDVTPKGLVGQTTIEFTTSNYWEVTVPLVVSTVNQTQDDSDWNYREDPEESGQPV